MGISKEDGLSNVETKISTVTPVGNTLNNESSVQPQSVEHIADSSSIIGPAQTVKIKTKTDGNSVGTILTDIFEILFFVAVVWFVLHFVLQNFRVEGSSMEPTLHDGEYLFVNKAVYFHSEDTNPLYRFLPGDTQVDAGGHQATYPFHRPSRGDIIVFRYPHDQTKDYIKRVIALPGETVGIKQDPKGLFGVYVNGNEIAEPYIKDPPITGYSPQTVPQGYVFVLGDNRNNSSDSRSWGMLNDDLIIGKAFVIYWPYAELGLISSSSVDYK